MNNGPIIHAIGDTGDPRGRILLVDDDPGLLRLLSIRLHAEGYEIEAVESAEAALGALPVFRPDLVITDLRMDNMDGIGLLKEIQRRRPGLCVLLLTAHGTIPDAVEATQSGAFGFLTKPVDKKQLLEHVERALKLTGAQSSEEEWRRDIITRSPAMEACLQQAQRVADGAEPILITGESGTGKELLARAIHRASGREGEFTSIKVSASPENELESGVLRHAVQPGTLLLDEIGDMPVRLQVKLIRVLEEDQVRPVDADAARPLRARLISTSNQNLHEQLAAGRLREELFYRLSAVQLRLPALRERREDIPLLVEHFLAQNTREEGAERKVFAPEAVELLVANNWPGNVRQLRNVVRQNAALSPTRVISPEHVRTALGQEAKELPSFSEARDEFTRNYLAQLLQITGGNVSQAARLAKRNRTDFYKLLGRHQLVPDHFK
jgi:two-component system response regulator GlrR